ncbi:hypothetical protein C8A00DRAFT_31065 [Chaetomidium leptoderma]|uniref:Uncharacterized protein n=1 Tax=Chaetomidium leptoderma TaxID=669021 RepID=A0AAN6VT76_9PEZI|nr:hypothetical protein C8A00DRAFT_31065 [Chaetomidium leptoderma]
MFLSTPPSALRAASARPWLSISSGVALRQRWFSTSPTNRAGNIITFGETSSPELAELLDSFRQKVILPSYLAGEQRKKIYKAKLKHILQNDPITMEIDGVVHKFRHLNQMQDLPNTHGSWTSALALMKTLADFQNVQPLLEGCMRDRRRVSPDMHVKIIRRAALHDSLEVVMDCVRAVQRTGFKLDRSEIINELLVCLQWPAISSGWNAGKTKTALRQIQLVLDILESDKSHMPKDITVGAFRFYQDPQVLAARLHMAAARAVYHQDGKDVDGKVTKYAEEIVALWPEGNGLLDLQPDASYADRWKMKYLLHRNTYLWLASPVLNGLMLAAQVVDPGLAMQLQNRADMVDAEVKTALSAPERVKSGKAENMYQALFNPQAKEEVEEEAA